MRDVFEIEFTTEAYGPLRAAEEALRVGYGVAQEWLDGQWRPVPMITELWRDTPGAWSRVTVEDDCLLAVYDGEERGEIVPVPKGSSLALTQSDSGSCFAAVESQERQTLAALYDDERWSYGAFRAAEKWSGDAIVLGSNGYFAGLEHTPVSAGPRGRLSDLAERLKRA